MRNILIATAAVAMLMLGTANIASAKGVCNGNKACSDNSVDKSVTNKGGSAIQGQLQGQQQGQQQGIFGSGNSSSKSGVKNSGNSKQGQGQGQSVNVEDNSVSTYTAAASTAHAAALAASAGACMGSSSAGAQGMSFGISLGSTWSDIDCNRRKFAAFLIATDQKLAALALVCQNSNVAAAMASAGAVCPSVKAPATAATDETVDTAWIDPDKDEFGMYNGE